MKNTTTMSSTGTNISTTGTATPPPTPSCSSSPNQSLIISQQMSSLDSTDPYANIWNDHLSQITNETSIKQQQLLWRGSNSSRGKGGRGVSRTTIQPRDVIIPSLTLEYVSESTSGCVGSKVLLNDAKLKLLSTGSTSSGSRSSSSRSSNNTASECKDSATSATGITTTNRKGKVYALVGRNGCGKSTLLRRIDAKKIPGFINLHLQTMYIPQEVYESDYGTDGSSSSHNDKAVVTPMDVVLGFRSKNQHESKIVNQKRIQQLEEELEQIMNNDNHNNNNDNNEMEMEMERICNEIALLEENEDEDNENDQSSSNNKNDELTHQASQVLSYFGIDENKQHTSMSLLSGGLKKKVLLACALFCDMDILLLDEPTNHLDMQGIIQLRGFIQTMAVERQTIIVLVSHDVDLINSVATDVIHFTNQKLIYYRGNYIDFQRQKYEHDIHKIRQQTNLDKQRHGMMKTIDNLEKQKSNVSNKSGSSSKKISKAVNNRKKKLERVGLETDEFGHRWTQQKAGSGIKIGSINSLDASTRKQSKNNYVQLLKRPEINVAPVPDKEVQFKFRDVNSHWHEPLISVVDVGHGFMQKNGTGSSSGGGGSGGGDGDDEEVFTMLFDNVDLCIEEGSTTCILGENQTGKTTLLKILSGELSAKEGKVQFAQNINISYFNQHKADNLIVEGINEYGSTTSSISLLMSKYPKKTEQDIRGELTSFGLSPQQASTYIQFLSGGERCRLCLAMLMLNDPHVLILDEPSNHLDPESVDALAFGIQHWNGTVLLVSHDVHLVRQLDAKCYVLMKEGKLKYVQGGIDSYLNYVSMLESKKLELDSNEA